MNLNPAKIIGADLLDKKKSSVSRKKELTHNTPIHDLVFIPTTPVAHEDGYLTEIARMDQAIIGPPIMQVHLTSTLAGRNRAWSLHQKNMDRLFLVSGLVKFVVFDGRIDSPSYGAINEIIVSDRTPGLLLIPPFLHHGWKNIGNTDALIINMPTYLYDYENPDGFHLAWDSETAKNLIDYDF